MPRRTVLASCRAFTLMELLVVISIIALLAAMLLPSIALVRSAARATRCMAHIRQLPMAVEAYAVATDGQLLLGKLGSNPQWETLLATVVPEVLGASATIEQTVSGNTATQSIVRGCPEFRGALNVTLSDLSWSSGYGFNVRPLLPGNPWAYNWKWTGSGTQMMLVQVQDKSSRIAFGDADDWWLNALGAGGDWGTVTQPRAWEVPWSVSSGRVKAGMEGRRRHRGLGVYAFFDGHVEKLASARAIDQFMDPTNSKGLNTL